MDSRWTVKKDNKPIASGSMATMYPDDIVSKLIAAGYKVYIDGKLYRPTKKGG